MQHPLIDADILRYEIGYAAETGWKAVSDDPDAVPPWDYVERLWKLRVQSIIVRINPALPPEEFLDVDPTFYFTTTPTFRYDVAKTKPYKGQRPAKKPWHFDNMTIYLRHILEGVEATDQLEADDMMAIDALRMEDVVLCSRDKDLKQVVGATVYSWELGGQPEWGPTPVSDPGYLNINQKRKVGGMGTKFFWFQMLAGDVADNIGGIPKVGDVGAYNALDGKNLDQCRMAVEFAYRNKFGVKWKDVFNEHCRLLWIIRERDAFGRPVECPYLI
jgi:hypothetical protein